MVFTESDLQDRLAAIRQQAKKSFETYERQFEEHHSWLQSVLDGLRNGSINVRSVLVPKTPGKCQAPLTAISESLESTLNIDEDVSTSSITKNKRGRPRKAQTKKPGPKSRKAPIYDNDEESDTPLATRPPKRLSEDDIETASKRLRSNRSSATISRDSGLSSVGSRNTRGSTLSGAAVKQEILTPKNTSEDNYVSVDNGEGNSLISNDESAEPSPAQCPPTVKPAKKRTRSAGRGTFVVKEELRRSLRSHSEPRTPNAKRHASMKDSTFVTASETNSPLSSPTQSLSINAVPDQSLAVKAPPKYLVTGDSVKKAVKAFEALSDSNETETAFKSMAPPAIPKAPAVAKGLLLSSLSSASSLDEALNAPTRVTRTKTRAMAKAAAAVTDEEKRLKEEQSASAASKILKSPVRQIQQLQSSQKYVSAVKADKKVDDRFEKEASTFSGSKIVLKPFGSASKQPSYFLKGLTPLNRMNPLTPSHSASTSFSGPRNLVTSVDSFVMRPVAPPEVKVSREENLQKLVSKTEVASKKKEEIMKAQLEERIKKRQEKRLKVCAAREAMEKEKFEMQQRLEREREEKQKQLQAEREEKLRQEYLKKKLIAKQKAAETEERRRQEEAARLAKLKQQEEEQKRIAAQRKKEQEEAERKHMERMQQEKEAAVLRAKEAERLAKEAAAKAKLTVKAQLDQTYDKYSPASHSYGMTPVPEERKPSPNVNPDNYGIDDVHTDDSSEDESKPKKMVPLWAQSKQRLPKLKDDYEINHRQMFTFFESQKSTPDLSKIFTAIDRRQLIRKSSAVWRTPPVKYF